MPEADYLSVTRAAYDTVAVDYARLLADALDQMPWDRAVLATFAELVSRDRLGAVADIGCGPGRITGYLHSLGLDAFGVDLSPGMLAVARQALPGLRFVEGSLTGLDLPDASLGGLVAWYSLIHIPPVDVPAVLTELGRVLVPGGQLLLAFQVGEGAPAPAAGLRSRHLPRRLSHAAAPARPAAGCRWPARARPCRAGPRGPGDRGTGVPAGPQDLGRPLLTALRRSAPSAPERRGVLTRA